MREVRLAWIAGVIEGEGWLGIKPPKRPTVQVHMTDEDVVRRLHQWSGVGNVQGPIAARAGQTKDTYRWVVGAREDAAQLIRDILPFLGERRGAKAREVLAIHATAPPRRGTEPHCKWNHPFSGDNLVVTEDGRRRCRTCINDRAARYRKRQRA